MSFSFPYLKYAVGNLFKKSSCDMYPFVESVAAEKYRGRIAYDSTKCINCGLCMKVCSPSAITRTEEDVEGGKKITFRFDLTSCTFCGMCKDFCPQKAIDLTADYGMVGKREELFTEGSYVKEAPAGKLGIGEDCVYCGLCAKMCPQGAITVDRANKSWTVDEDKCVKCGVCVSKCPKKTLAFQKPQVQCGEDCVYCGLCAKMCPQGAITVDRPNKSWTVDEEKCVLCGMCVSKCPKKTLKI